MYILSIVAFRLTASRHWFCPIIKLDPPTLRDESASHDDCGAENGCRSCCLGQVRLSQTPSSGSLSLNIIVLRPNTLSDAQPCNNVELLNSLPEDLVTFTSTPVLDSLKLTWILPLNINYLNRVLCFSHFEILAFSYWNPAFLLCHEVFIKNYSAK